MTSTVQQQFQEPNILNLENKLRQQSKIAHEIGAGSQCLQCGPKCQGFDLHFWRKVCRNCRCSKENHSVIEENYDTTRVGRLFDEYGNNEDNGNRDKLAQQGVAPNSKVTQQMAVGNSGPVIVQIDADVDKRNRALVRQLPEHDLDPTKCQSLSDPDKQKMEEYVNNVKQFAVGRGMLQKRPAPPPQLDRILEQKLSLINANNNLPSLSKSPKVSPKPPPKFFGAPKPYTPFKTDNPISTGGSVPKSAALGPSFTEQIKREASKPSANSVSLELPDDLLPPPAEFLEPFAEEQTQQSRSKDPVREFFDFIDEQEGKKLPGRLTSQSKSPFLSNFNTAPKPFGSPRMEQKISKPSAFVPKPDEQHSVPKLTGNAKPQTQTSNDNFPQLLTTDFDYTPDNGNYSTQSQEPQQFQPKLPGAQQTSQSESRQPPETRQSETQQPRQPEIPRGHEAEIQQQIAVEAEKVWFCFKCLGPILANQVAIFAERAGEDKCWHPECFVCNICNETLADLIYFYAEGNIYCGRHYAEQMNIPRCKACDELIFASEYTNAEGANWHTNHFCCWICDTPLVGRQYTPIEGQPHCLDCYQKKYGKDCHLCSKPIRADEARVGHGDLYWHAQESCFRCQQCNNSLLNRQFLLKGQSTFCSRDCATKAKVTETK